MPSNKTVLGVGIVIILVLGAFFVYIFTHTSPVTQPNEIVTGSTTRTSTSTQPASDTSVHFDSETTLKSGETIQFTDGLHVTLKEINDSRCKPGVQCIWAGELAPVLSVTGGDLGMGVKEVYLGTVKSKSVTVSGYAFLLINATTTEATIRVSKNAPVLDKTPGYAIGHVTIGPICPVERFDHPCEVPPETYTSRNVVAFAADKTTEKGKKALDAHGDYTLSLSPGVYWLQIQPAGIGPGEMKQVTIAPREVSKIDFDIDTGIR
jgi:hypothetical protein